MKSLIRKVSYKMYPNKTQLEQLDFLFVHHHQLYNWALSDRIKTYQQSGYSLTFSDQCAINTVWRNTRKSHKIFNANAQSEQVTLKRVARAFEGFFRRLKQGDKKPGFPRFKSFNRFSSFGFKSHGDGWKLHLKEKKHGAVYLANVGTVKIRGKARNENGTPKTAEVLKKADGWYLSVAFEYKKIERTSGTKGTGLDWGIEYYMTMIDDQGQYKQIDNPRFLKQSKDVLTVLQQQLALAKQNTRAWNKLRKKIARVHQHIARQRLNLAHQTTAQIVKDSGLIAIETLNVKNMSRSAKGTIEKPGKMVPQKAGLNREILNTIPSLTYSMLRYKAAEADSEFIEVPSRKVKPSQTCPGCHQQLKKSLSQRWHSCECGIELPRDVASAQVNLNWALGISV